MKLGTDGAQKERGWGSASEPVPLMRPVAIVVAHELIEGVLQAATAGEVPPAEGHPPVLLQDRALQPLDESVGPGMPWLGAGVTNPELATGLIEGALELGTAVGQHPAQRPARLAVQRRQDVAQEPGGVDRRVEASTAAVP